MAKFKRFDPRNKRAKSKNEVQDPLMKKRIKSLKNRKHEEEYKYTV